MPKLFMCVLALALFASPVPAQQKLHKKQKGQGLTVAVIRHAVSATSLRGSREWAPIADTDGIFTTDHQAVVVVHALVRLTLGNGSGTSCGYVSISIDGQTDAEVPRSCVSENNGQGAITIPLLYTTTVQPGQHTVRLEWRLEDDSDATDEMFSDLRKMTALVY